MGNSPGISRNEDLRETDDIGALLGSLLNKRNGLCYTSLEVVPGRLGLDGSNLELRSHGDCRVVLVSSVGVEDAVREFWFLANDGVIDPEKNASGNPKSL